MSNTTSTIKNISKAIITRIESDENGQSMVEMVLALGFLLVLTFGMIDVSRCIYTNSVVAAAAQEGARAGLIDTDEIHGVVANKMMGLDMSSANINITVQDEIVKVEIDYAFELVTPLASSLMDNLALNGKASMLNM